MITPEMIARINELARKQRGEGLTEAEKEEQARLRRLYIDHIKGQVKDALDPARTGDHQAGCDCGCHGKH